MGGQEKGTEGKQGLICKMKKILIKENQNNLLQIRKQDIHLKDIRQMFTAKKKKITNKGKSQTKKPVQFIITFQDYCEGLETWLSS